jgi:hypothetical protein
MAESVRDLTAREAAVLAHVVVDPAGWWAHCAEFFSGDLPEQHLAAKVAKYAADYDAKKNDDGYKTRAVKWEEDEAQLAADTEAAVAKVKEESDAAAAKEAALEARIAALEAK